ncbi:MAG: hypothetical protein U0Y82_05645 [Thermoleophilia bacterium]
MSRFPRSTPALAAALGLSALLVPAVSGAAAVVLEPTGATTLTLQPATARVLSSLGVKVAPAGPARAHAGGAIAFPITGGRVHSLATGAATVDHSGGLVFSAHGTRLKVTDFRVRLGASPLLTAKAGGARIPLLKLDASKAKITFTNGANLKVSNVRGALTPQAARALNATFGVTAFTGGIRIGTTTTKATAYSTAVTLDPALASALSGAGITAAPIGPAGADHAGRLVFPVSGGGLSRTTFAGDVPHLGGIRLAKGSTKVDLTAFTVRTSVTPPDLTAEVGGARASILSVGLQGVMPSVAKGTVVLPGATLTLTPAAAGLLNQAFGLGSTLTGTTAFGTATVRAPVR